MSDFSFLPLEKTIERLSEGLQLYAENIVGSYQNHTALVRLAVLFYTVCGSLPCLLLL